MKRFWAQARQVLADEGFAALLQLLADLIL